MTVVRSESEAGEKNEIHNELLVAKSFFPVDAIHCELRFYLGLEKAFGFSSPGLCRIKHSEGLTRNQEASNFSYEMVVG